jgi:ubiquinone/menaquinone biosynthesis C-methylase UbiE
MAQGNAGMTVDSLFNARAESYDAWYDTPSGRAAFAEEVDALRPLLGGLSRPWLEVGVGTGRFAAALGVDMGLDPARAALALARARGVAVVQGVGEALPFRERTFGALLLTFTLCFLTDPARALREAHRVLRRDGALMLGFIPAEGPWGRYYRALAAQGHPYYAHARFYSRAEAMTLLAESGFVVVRRRAALHRAPRAAPDGGPAREGDSPEAGFLALRAEPR